MHSAWLGRPSTSSMSLKPLKSHNSSRRSSTGHTGSGGSALWGLILVHLLHTIAAVSSTSASEVLQYYSSKVHQTWRLTRTTAPWRRSKHDMACWRYMFFFTCFIKIRTCKKNSAKNCSSKQLYVKNVLYTNCKLPM